MGVGLVQQFPAAITGTATITLDADVSRGNLVVVTLECAGTLASANPLVSDPVDSEWVQTAIVDDGVVATQTWYTLFTEGGSPDITITLTGSPTVSVNISEWSGGPFTTDPVYIDAQNNFSATISPGTFSSASYLELIVASASFVLPLTSGPIGGFTALSIPGNATCAYLISEYPGGYNPIWIMGGDANWVSTAVGFYGYVPPGPMPPPVSADTTTLYGFLPPFVQEQDAENGWQFLLWLDGIVSQLQVIDNLCRDMNGNPGWSQILNVAVCPEYALPWLAQFVGVRFNSFDLAGGIQGMQNKIVNLPNFNRGTPDAIESVATQFVAADGYVTLIERYPDPYSLSVILTNSSDVYTYVTLQEQYPTYPEVSAAFPDYDNFPTSNETLVTQTIESEIPAGLIPNISFN